MTPMHWAPYLLRRTWLMQTVTKREAQHNEELHNRYDYNYPYNRPRKRHERDGAIDLDATLMAKVRGVLVLATLSTVCDACR